MMITYCQRVAIIINQIRKAWCRMGRSLISGGGEYSRYLMGSWPSTGMVERTDANGGKAIRGDCHCNCVPADCRSSCPSTCHCTSWQQCQPSALADPESGSESIDIPQPCAFPLMATSTKCFPQ